MRRVVCDPQKYNSAIDAMIRSLKQRGIRSELVLKAMRETLRPLFVDLVMEVEAYDKGSVPIGQGQTISQPYTVALMTELLLTREGRAPGKVLEIGTGSGYQTAILEKIGVRDIYSVERIALLYEKAKRNLRSAGCVRSRLIFGDGSKGLPSRAPYDAIIVTAAASRVPDELLGQLCEGGRLVIPVCNPQSGAQDLMLIERSGYRDLRYRVAEVNFVPLLRGVIENFVDGAEPAVGVSRMGPPPLDLLEDYPKLGAFWAARANGRGPNPSSPGGLAALGESSGTSQAAIGPCFGRDPDGDPDPAKRRGPADL